MRRPFILLLLLFLVVGARARAASPPLLVETIENWLGERDHWSFTQRAVEYKDGVPHERRERFDPSKEGDRRWTLLAINGQPPTNEQRLAWEKKKFKKNRRRFDSPLGDYFDFERAKLIDQDAKSARYSLPLRNDKNWLFPTDKVDVVVTINKETRALDHLTAKVREPFKVLLGIARITGGAIDLNFEDATDPTPESAQPNGSVNVSVSRFGERIDFIWSDFKRVAAPAGRGATAATREP